MSAHKYKAWVKDAGVMSDVTAIEWNAEGPKWVTLLNAIERGYDHPKLYGSKSKKLIASRVILRRGSGLRDKNNIELFEGDIYRTDGTDYLCYEVVYLSGAFCGGSDGEYIPLAWDSEDNEVIESPQWVPKEVEIVGNIYQHPTLMIEEA